MFVSVQLATYNRCKLLKHLLFSLEKQTVERSMYEILVCDSSSSDGTKSMIGTMQKKFSNIKYYNINKNTLSAKRNYLLDKTEADLIITLDDDLVVSNNFIEIHQNAHKNINNIVFCGHVEFPQSWVQKSNYYKFRNYSHKVRGVNQKYLPYNRIVVMNMSFKKSEIKILPFFMDESFVRYGGEDQDFGYRLIKEGIKIAYLKDAVVTHYETSDLKVYLYKQYVAARHGFKRLVFIHSDFPIGNIKILSPVNSNDSIKLKATKYLVSTVINEYSARIIEKLLMLNDRGSFQCYPLYRYLVARAIMSGLRDQDMVDNNSTWL